MFWFGHRPSKNKGSIGLGRFGDLSLNKKMLEKLWDCDEDEKK
jgi:hypothetical protein